MLQSGQGQETSQDDEPFDDVLSLSDVGELRTVTIGPDLPPAPVAASEQVRLAALAAVLQERGQTAAVAPPGLDSILRRESYKAQRPLGPGGSTDDRAAEAGEVSPWLNGLLFLSLVACSPDFFDRKHTDRYFAELGASGGEGSDETAC
jgi:hypothetical protein